MLQIVSSTFFPLPLPLFHPYMPCPSSSPSFHCSPSHTILPPSHPSTSLSSPSPLLHIHILIKTKWPTPSTSPHSLHTIFISHHATYQSTSPNLLSLLSTSPSSSFASYNQSMHIKSYIPDPLTSLSFPTSIALSLCL